MPASFLHGVETVEIQTGTRPIRGVRTAVIGLVGTAPLWQVAAADQKVNEPVLITSMTDAAKYFGTAVAGYTIPQALAAIFAQGRGIAVVVNVFDPATHKTAVVAADYVLDANGVATLPDQGVRGVVVKDDAAETTYVVDTDYTLDSRAGAVTRIADGAILAGATLKINYDKPDPTLVVAADVTGTVDEGGDRTGLEALKDTPSLFGVAPRLLIAPAFCTQESVATALSSLADSLRAMALVDAPIGTTLAVAIAGRGNAGAINFETGSERVILCYPHVKIYDAATDAEVLEPLSQRLAGVIAARDVDLGYWWSPSNAELNGVIGMERQLTASISDAGSEVNQLNAVGITTVFNGYGTGFRVWGNRSAAYPTVSHPRNMVAVRRTADVVHDSIESAMLQFLDQPITDALVDSIAESVNAFLRGLIGRGALIDGVCAFDPAKNPPEEIAAGHVTFDVTFMPSVPAERITFESYIDTQLLRTIGAQSA